MNECHLLIDDSKNNRILCLSNGGWREDPLQDTSQIFFTFLTIQRRRHFMDVF